MTVTTENNGGSNAPGAFLVFFSWSLAPDLRFSLGQTNTCCKLSVNISIIFSRLASIHKHLDEKRRRKLLAKQGHKNLFDESKDKDDSKLSKAPIRSGYSDQS